MVDFKLQGQSSSGEINDRSELVRILLNKDIPNDELIFNISVFLRRQELSKILFINEIYKQIVDSHGIIMEFGVRWGSNTVLLQNLRGIYEPFNYNRKIVAFDTFSGFKGVDESMDSATNKDGNYDVIDNYDIILNDILSAHERQSPIAHIKKFEIVKGDAGPEVRNYLKSHPETIISLAYFDFDIYKPTMECIEAIMPHLARGSILVFDELNVEKFPGETLAFKEAIGLKKYKIRRNKFSSLQSYIVIE